MIFTATGHRPNKLGGYDDATFRKLVNCAQTFLFNDDVTHVITGMALGWDQAVAQACINLDLPFTAAVPFDGMERIWPDAAKARWVWLLKHAKEAHIVSPGDYAPWKLQKRNEWMVDRADLVFALWDGSSGGTANCLAYAERRRKRVVNLWSQWSSL